MSVPFGGKSVCAVRLSDFGEVLIRYHFMVQAFDITAFG